MRDWSSRRIVSSRRPSGKEIFDLAKKAKKRSNIKNAPIGPIHESKYHYEQYDSHRPGIRAEWTVLLAL